MSNSGNVVPPPFVTELPPLTMASSNDIPKLPENKPDKKSLLPPIDMSSGDGQAQHEVKDEASSKDATSGNGVSLGSGDSANKPISPKTAISPRLYKFNRKDETEIQHYIAKAHTSVRQGQPTTSSDNDKDLAKFAEMVSQMTHLLAAAGVGRETTTRALAYMAGPDKPEPKNALWEAKKDRRKKNNARRDANSGSSKTNDSGVVGQDKDTAATRRDANKTSESTDPPKSMGQYTTASDDQKPSSDTKVPIMRKSNEAWSPPVSKAPEARADKAAKKKKSSGRRWWQRRGKGRSSQRIEGQEHAGQKGNTAEGQRENQATKDDNTKNDGTKNDDTKNDGTKEDTKSEGMEAPLASATNAPAAAA